SVSDPVDFAFYDHAVSGLAPWNPVVGDDAKSCVPVRLVVLGGSAGQGSGVTPSPVAHCPGGSLWPKERCGGALCLVGASEPVQTLGDDGVGECGDQCSCSSVLWCG